MESNLASLRGDQSIISCSCSRPLVFLKQSGKIGFALLPAVVMIVMPMTALVQMANSFGCLPYLGELQRNVRTWALLMVTSGVP